MIPNPLDPLLIVMGLDTIELRGLPIGLSDSSILLPEDVSAIPPVCVCVCVVCVCVCVCVWVYVCVGGCV